ncbi:hypothetical protein [Wielerella bovis]|nr:hypothetical protein [Wielerella bovis]
MSPRATRTPAFQRAGGAGVHSATLHLPPAYANRVFSGSLKSL